MKRPVLNTFFVPSLVSRHVDDTLNGSDETAIVNLKFDLLKARLSGPGGNTTGADGLTMDKANKTSNVDAASILMDPLDFYQVSLCLDSLVLPEHPNDEHNMLSLVLRIRSFTVALLQYPRNTK